MKNAWKIIACAALALPLMAVSANAGAGNKKQNNFYKISITGSLLVQQGDDYKKEKIKTNEVIQAVIDQLGKGEWKEKDCEIIMQIPDRDDPIGHIQWWIYHKEGRNSAHKAIIDGMISLDEGAGYASVVSRKFTAKGDNEKARAEFVKGAFMVNASGYMLDAVISGKIDVGLKGVKTIAFLNQFKLRSSGQMVDGAGNPGKINVQAKGRISNEDMNNAQDVTSAG
jgi:hypothetical protein